MHCAAEVHGDIIPIGELLGDAPIARGIVFLEIVQRRVRKHHAEAERIVGPVSLVDRDFRLRPLLLQQDRGIKTGGTSADNCDLHKSLRASGPISIILNVKHFRSKFTLKVGREKYNPDSPTEPVEGCIARSTLLRSS